MTKDELKQYLLNKLFYPQDIQEVLDAVDAYTAASNGAKVCLWLPKSASEKSGTDIHEVSKVKCGLCGKEWVAVRPKGLIKLESPNCENMVQFENL